MDLLIAFGFFLAGNFTCMAMGWSLAIGLALGLVCFFLVGVHRGYRPGELVVMAAKGGRTSFVVLRILTLIGCLTALWRASGTIAFFVHTGLMLITPHIFFLVAFLLAAFLSMAFGSAFGVAGTAGVILAAIARTGDANLCITAGAVLSGAYLGERISPASSAAALVAAISQTDQHEFQLRMWKTTALPLLVTLGFYGVLSALFPIQSVDHAMLQALEEGFHLSWITALPAVVLLVMPFFGFTAARSILVSCGVSALVALFLQKVSLLELVRAAFLGYVVTKPELTDIMSGGGLISMVNGMCIVLFSCSSSGILNGAHLLDPLKARLERIALRTDAFLTTILVSVSAAVVLCNQSIALVLSEQMVGSLYRDRGLGNLKLSQALGNTTIPLPAIVPWSIACSVPLAAMDASPASILFAMFLFACPLCDWVLHRKEYQVK